MQLIASTPKTPDFVKSPESSALAGAGATVPLTGFGYLLSQGAIEGAKEQGILGAFTGGVTAGAAGIAAAVFFGYLAALIFKPKMKS